MGCRHKSFKSPSLPHWNPFDFLIPCGIWNDEMAKLMTKVMVEADSTQSKAIVNDGCKPNKTPFHHMTSTQCHLILLS